MLTKKEELTIKVGDKFQTIANKYAKSRPVKIIKLYKENEYKMAAPHPAGADVQALDVGHKDVFFVAFEDLKK